MTAGHVNLAMGQAYAATQEGLSVLVLDDDMMDLKRITRLIEAADFASEIVTCQDFDQLKTALDTHDFDIALVDNRMGPFSGSDAVRVISSHHRSGPIPTIVVAGDTSPQDIVESMKSGVRDYLGKSNLTSDRLLESIKNALAEAYIDDAEFTEEHLCLISKKILGGVTKTCVAELGPIANRMFRRLNFIRDCISHRMLPSLDVLTAIETDVLILRRFLDDLEAHEQNFSRLN